MSYPSGPYPGGYAMPPGPTPPFAPAQPLAPQRRSVLPIVSLVISLIALLAVVGIGVGLASGALGPSGGDDAPLTGQLGKTPTGPVRGDELANEVTAIIADDGGDVSDLRCPDTPAVAQNVTTVCHGTISGSAYAVVVFFEDVSGRFTLLPV